MKKSILIAVLGVAACAATSYGQGFVVMNSYGANGGLGAVTSLQGGGPVGATFTAELYFALGTVSDPGNSGPVSGLFTPIASSIINYDANGDGYFQGGTITVPGYVSGPISFEILAIGGNASGRSSAFTESSVTSSAAAPPSFFGDNGTGMPSFVVPVPEPTTLALAGLGGLASLVALRRKQA
jgi:PEP-CTERM motif